MLSTCSVYHLSPSVLALLQGTPQGIVLLYTLRPAQNGCNFPHRILKWIFLRENICILIQISLKLFLQDPIDDISVLVEVMDWCRTATVKCIWNLHVWNYIINSIQFKSFIDTQKVLPDLWVSWDQWVKQDHAELTHYLHHAKPVNTVW